MKYLILLVAIIILSGCFNDTDDLVAYTEQVKVTTPNTIAPMPKIPQFTHVDYQANSLRSPFDAPRPEAIQEKVQQMSGCISPDPRRRKQPLEKFSLSNLVMRGTLGQLGVTWALVEASDKMVHRVGVGNYLGLYNGRVTEVSQDNIKVTELVPDGTGCWVERETVIAMVNSNKEGQSK